MSPNAPTVHALVLAGGSAQRLGGASKADLRVGGDRLLDLVLGAAAPAVTGRRVVVAPTTVAVPPGVGQTLEDPPLGGPLAGIAAGLAWLEEAAAAQTDDLVLVLAVDTPGAPQLVPLLVPASCRPGYEGAVVVGGEPEPFVQHLQACYRFGPLSRAVTAAGSPRGLSVRRVLRGLRLAQVRQPATTCRDLDTTSDLEHWQARLPG
ncbi:MAG: NTP transferase domain-containing protein [Actinomycetia bacterium]|nr:NTP transferase domain-containing protein [Actinomycetes bacterium]